MKTYYNHLHSLHRGKLEMFRGELVPCFEVPARVDHVLSELQRRRLGEVLQPQAFDDKHIASIHRPQYLHFLQNAWSEWVAQDPANAQRDALPSVWPIRTFRADVVPQSFAARMGLFSFDAGTPLTSGTWQAARAGADCALSAAAQVLSGDRAAHTVFSNPLKHPASPQKGRNRCWIGKSRPLFAIKLIAACAHSMRSSGRFDYDLSSAQQGQHQRRGNRYQRG